MKKRKLLPVNLYLGLDVRSLFVLGRLIVLVHFVQSAELIAIPLFLVLIFKLPDCSWVDCGNPWNYREMFVNPIPRLTDYFKGDPNPQPSRGFTTYGVNEKIVWLQFYTPIKNVLKSFRRVHI